MRTWFPGEEVYVFATLKAAGFDCMMLHPDLDHSERHKLDNNFNEHQNKDTILVMFYIIYSTELSLQ